MPLPLKQRALEGLLGHLWAAAAAPAVAAHSAGRGSSRSRVPDTPPQSQQQRAQPLQLQPPARPGAAADGRRTGPGSTAAHGPLTPGQLGMAARAFATVMGEPRVNLSGELRGCGPLGGGVWSLVCWSMCRWTCRIGTCHVLLGSVWVHTFRRLT